MNKVQYGVVVALLVVIAWIGAFRVLFPQRAAPSWEYRIEAINDIELVRELDRIGNAGWEIASARRAIMGLGEDGPGKGIYEVIFKRPK